MGFVVEFDVRDCVPDLCFLFFCCVMICVMDVCTNNECTCFKMVMLQAMINVLNKSCALFDKDEVSTQTCSCKTYADSTYKYDSHLNRKPII